MVSARAFSQLSPTLPTEGSTPASASRSGYRSRRTAHRDRCNSSHTGGFFPADAQLMDATVFASSRLAKSPPAISRSIARALRTASPSRPSERTISARDALVIRARPPIRRSAGPVRAASRRRSRDRQASVPLRDLQPRPSHRVHGEAAHDAARRFSLTGDDLALSRLVRRTMLPAEPPGIWRMG